MKNIIKALQDVQVEIIRQLVKQDLVSQAEIGREFCLTPAAISQYVKGARRTRVTLNARTRLAVQRIAKEYSYKSERRRKFDLSIALPEIFRIAREEAEENG